MPYIYFSIFIAVIAGGTHLFWKESSISNAIIIISIFLLIIQLELFANKKSKKENESPEDEFM